MHDNKSKKKKKFEMLHDFLFLSSVAQTEQRKTYKKKSGFFGFRPLHCYLFSIRLELLKKRKLPETAEFQKDDATTQPP